MGYNVVFEYTSKAGGMAGNRTRTSYRSRSHFEKLSPDDTQKVIAQGVTDDEGLNLVCLTPEVCRITAAIEQASYRNDGSIDLVILDHQLSMAEFAILHDRQHLDIFDLDPILDFEKLVIGPEINLKNQLLHLVVRNCPDPFGRVRLQKIMTAIQLCILDLVTDQLIDSLIDLSVAIDEELEEYEDTED